MRPALELLAAHLDDAQAPPLGAEILRALLQADDAVRDAVQLKVARIGRLVVEQQHGARAVREEVLQREDLAPVAQRILCQQAHLGQAVEDDAVRLDSFDLRRDAADRLAELDFGRVEDRLLGIRVAARAVDQLEHVDAVERPAVRRDHRLQFLCRFGQRDVEAALPGCDAGQQKSQGERRLAGAGRALEQVEAVRRQAAAQDGVEPGDPGRLAFGSLGLVGHLVRLLKVGPSSPGARLVRRGARRRGRRPPTSAELFRVIRSPRSQTTPRDGRTGEATRGRRR